MYTQSSGFSSDPECSPSGAEATPQRCRIEPQSCRSCAAAMRHPPVTPLHHPCNHRPAPCAPAAHSPSPSSCRHTPFWHAHAAVPQSRRSGAALSYSRAAAVPRPCHTPQPLHYTTLAITGLLRARPPRTHPPHPAAGMPPFGTRTQPCRSHSAAVPHRATGLQPCRSCVAAMPHTSATPLHHPCNHRPAPCTYLRGTAGATIDSTYG